MSDPITLHPVAVVRSPRKEPRDDYWGEVEASVELDAERFDAEALAGLEAFSHLEVVYYFHSVPDAKVRTGARRPRNREDWPRVGIFAQRAKGRPNRVGVSRCRLVAVEGTRLRVKDLDAIDGTPVIDIKPYVAEMGPIGATHQPPWITELMQDYYTPSSDDPR